MLIHFSELINFLKVPIKGILHVGAHDCEEQDIYNKYMITPDKVLWFEAMPKKVEQQKNLHPNYNIYHIVASDLDNQEVNFNITNNGQSSSMLELETHLKHHPEIHVIDKVTLKTSRMDTFLKNNNVDIKNYNFINMDIQGAELKALTGFGELLNSIDYIYAEVNSEHLYKDCALVGEIDDYLAKFGFERVLIKMTRCQWGDAFYVKKNK